MRAQFTPIKKDTDIGGLETKPQSQKTVRLHVHWNKKTVLIIVSAICMAALLVLLGVWIARRMPQGSDTYTSLPGQAAAVPELSEKQVKELVQTVGKHIVLPGETPTIVQISNVDQLKVDQPFFRSALNGDQLLVYPSRVILYRPSTDQIVDIAQIRPNTQQGASQSSPSAKLQ